MRLATQCVTIPCFRANRAAEALCRSRGAREKRRASDSKRRLSRHTLALLRLLPSLAPPPPRRASLGMEDEANETKFQIRDSDGSSDDPTTSRTCRGAAAVVAHGRKRRRRSRRRGQARQDRTRVGDVALSFDDHVARCSSHKGAARLYCNVRPCEPIAWRAHEGQCTRTSAPRRCLRLVGDHHSTRERARWRGGRRTWAGVARASFSRGAPAWKRGPRESHGEPQAAAGRDEAARGWQQAEDGPTHCRRVPSRPPRAPRSSPTRRSRPWSDLATATATSGWARVAWSGTLAACVAATCTRTSSTSAIWPCNCPTSFGSTTQAARAARRRCFGSYTCYSPGTRPSGTL